MTPASTIEAPSHLRRKGTEGITRIPRFGAATAVRRCGLARVALFCAAIAFPCTVQAHELCSVSIDGRQDVVAEPEVDAVPDEFIVTFEAPIKLRDLFNLHIWSRSQLNLKLSPSFAGLDEPKVEPQQASELFRVWLNQKARAVHAVFSTAFAGFSAKLNQTQLALLCSVPQVSVVRNLYIRLSPEEALPVLTPAFTDTDPPLGLDRIDQRALGLNYRDTLTGNGAGVHVYVIDSGIQPFHREFLVDPNATGAAMRSRVLWEIKKGGYNAYISNVPQERNTIDCNGHGTRVAGIIGGNTVGVARRVILHSVRVFGCGPATKVDYVIDAVEWVTSDRKAQPSGSRAVVNMSLASRDSTLAMSPADANAFTRLNQAIEKSIVDAHLTYVIAAGNNSTPQYPFTACDISPAKVTPAITVGSIDPLNDARAETSNEGKCVDLFAPGWGIKTADIRPGVPYDTFQGTSMAAPHVTGVIALYLQNHDASPDEIWKAIFNAASKEGAEQQSKYPAWCGVGNIDETIDPPTPHVLLHWGSGSVDGVEDDPTVPPNPETQPDCTRH